MTTTFANLVTQISYEMADTTWDDAYVAYWLNMAIRDYSKYFPLLKSSSITTYQNDQKYGLPADFMKAVSVEHPTGEDPPQYLTRKDHAQPDFWTADYFYDIIHHHDDTDADEIWISYDPPVDEGTTITVYYHASHVLISNPASISGSCSVPPYHHNLLSLFVFWQNALALANAEQQSPTSNSSLLMAQLAQNSRRAENAYHVALRQALYAAGGESRPIEWVSQSGTGPKDNSLGRIY